MSNTGSLRGGEAASRVSTWRRGAAGLLVLALIVGALAFVLASLREPHSDYRPVTRASALDAWQPAWPDSGPRAHASRPKKWIVMGWDGAAWSVILPLLEAGKLPHLEALMREGSYGNLSTIQPTTSPALWTTIATGVSPTRHGIVGFDKPPGGIDRLRKAWFHSRPSHYEFFSNADRRVKALWNLASDNGRTVVVVGYHNTFPAEEVRGAMVSNYLVRQEVLSTLPGTRSGGDTAAFVYPADLTAEVARWIRLPRNLSFDEVRRFSAVTEQGFDRLMHRYRQDPAQEERWGYLLKAYAYDEFHARATEELQRRLDPDFLLLHFQCTDWAGHNFLYFHAPSWYADLPGAKAMKKKLEGELERYAKTVEAFYEYADDRLGRLLAARDANTAVLVLSDHGMEPDANSLESGTHNAAPAGMLVMSGPGIRTGHRIDDATLYDILPTLMASSGLPVANDLEGKVLEGAFESGTLQAGWPHVASYESGTRYRPRVELGASLHDEVEKELRGLGYIR